ITTTLSGRTWTKPPAMAKLSELPPLRISSSPTPSRLTSGVWCGRMPSSPSMPGTSTMSTSSSYASRSGVTTSRWRVIGRSPRQLRRVLADVVEGAREEEGLLGQVVRLALEDLLERGDGVLDADVLAGAAREDLGDGERLAHEPLQSARARDGRLVLLGQLVDPEDRDDVLEVAEALEDTLRLLRHVVVVVAHDERVEDARRRRQRVDGRVDAQLRDGPLEADRRVEVGEGRRRRGVGVVVRGDEHGLERRDRALVGRGDPLLEAGHLRREVGLVAHGGRHAPEERRHLGARLREAEDVVDEQEDVAALLVAEVLGHRQAREADPLTGAGRLVHLAEHERGALDDARLGHLVDEVV